MKKSVLSLIALAIASVSVFTSCDKNDDGYGQAAKPEAQVSTSTTTPAVSPTMANTAQFSVFAFGITDDMAELGTYTVTLTDGDQTAEYDLVKQGSHKDLEVSKKKFPGYILVLSRPYSSTMKASVKFTPNDKVKSLTQDQVLTMYGVKYKGTVTNTTDNIKMGAVGFGQLHGDNAEKACNDIVYLLNI